LQVGAISERNVGSTASGIQRPRSLDTENDEGTELKIIEPRKPIHYVTRATFDITQTPVDTTIEFPIRDHKQEKSKMSVNGTEVTGALFQPHNNVKCGIGGASNSSNTSQSKIVPSLCSVMPASWQTQNITMGKNNSLIVCTHSACAALLNFRRFFCGYVRMYVLLSLKVNRIIY